MYSTYYDGGPPGKLRRIGVNRAWVNAPTAAFTHSANSSMDQCMAKSCGLLVSRESAKKFSIKSHRFPSSSSSLCEIYKSLIKIDKTSLGKTGQTNPGKTVLYGNTRFASHNKKISSRNKMCIFHQLILSWIDFFSCYIALTSDSPMSDTANGSHCFHVSQIWQQCVGLTMMAMSNIFLASSMLKHLSAKKQLYFGTLSSMYRSFAQSV